MKNKLMLTLALAGSLTFAHAQEETVIITYHLPSAGATMKDVISVTGEHNEDLYFVGLAGADDVIQFVTPSKPGYQVTVTMKDSSSTTLFAYDGDLWENKKEMDFFIKYDKSPYLCTVAFDANQKAIADISIASEASVVYWFLEPSTKRVIVCLKSEQKIDSGDAYSLYVTYTKGTTMKVPADLRRMRSRS